MKFLNLFKGSTPERVEIEQKKLEEITALATKGEEAAEMQAQIKDLTAKISGLESDYNAKLGEWETKFNSLEAENASLKNENADLEKTLADKEAILEKVNRKFIAQNKPTQGAKTGTEKPTIEEVMTNLYAGGAKSIDRNDFERLMMERNAKTDY